ncbi:hypothetical protein G1K75_04025 [Tenacibaculum finnmarkense]|uniref:hypothetical protein n=1 Tax=Tenacibaculum finnmarkense TaxID=2781243 RepID=UPI001EFBE46F|nr:hypothetical protein [Tenacibaculum finnmarkense]MCG8804820.1 hypothetical protein [Tenacibaculum finnmarkense]MCG8856346.1 hypothetical protein [Tenacibaculum finnmarkense]
MKNINERELLELLSSENEVACFDSIINLGNSKGIDLSKVTSYYEFINCQFKGVRLSFYDSSFSEKSELNHFIHFENCEFENDVFFRNCSFEGLKFSEMTKPINLNLSRVKLGFFVFECDKYLEIEVVNKINIKLYNCEIFENLSFFHLKSLGNLEILGCTIKKVEIDDCLFNRIDIGNNKFSKEFQFTSNSIDTSYIKHNEFEKTNFSLTNFGDASNFRFNEFKGTALFKRLKNEKTTIVKFEECIFHQYTDFNKSKLYDLHIDTSVFQDIVSFQELELDFIFLDRTIFEKLAFFDDIEIHKVNKCSKRTLRNIKQQLLRADNRIDYDNFRAYELNLFKEELKTKIRLQPNANRKKLRRNLTILRVNSFFSNNGTDWFRAIKRTLVVAILFYSIFYGIHNYTRELEFSWSSWNDYFIGLFRYFLLTDFHNPLINSREYLIDIKEWIPFVLGKILIGIGFYHILISFRKYRR